MGGRGSSGGANSVVAVANRTKGGWDYKGNDQRISQLSSALSGARSASKINAVSVALRQLDKNVTSEINRVMSGAEKDGSLSALMAQRRKIRKLMSKAKI